MPITSDKTQERYIVRLEGDVDIGRAAELKAALMEAIASRKEVCLDLDGVTDLDVTAVQLLWAAAREMEGAGGSLSIAGQNIEVLTCAADEMGLDFALPRPSDVVTSSAAVTNAEKTGD